MSISLINVLEAQNGNNAVQEIYRQVETIKTTISVLVLVGVLMMAGAFFIVVSNVINLPEVHVSTSTGEVVAVYDQGKLITDESVQAELLAGRWSGGAPVYEP